MEDRPYEVAISFAGEQRSYAAALARHLSRYGIAHFYDADNEAHLWGKNLAEEFHGIYTSKSRFVLMLVSKEYIEKQWCRHERRSAIAEGLKRKEEFILPLRFDDTWPPPGMPEDTGYQDASKKTAAEIVAIIAEKLGISLYAGKASSVPPPQSSSWIGTADFDYESFNGHFIIGDNKYAFETHWTTAGDGSIHVYNDGANVNGVAVAYGVKSFAQLTDASALDFTSRARTVSEGEIVVYRNNAGLYGIIKVEKITTRRGATPANLKFWYAINRDGSSDFSEYDLFD